eukprot:TRINITY_DN122_c0_g1_i4.p1 TRINITY_DN122_c0_g1~~TRINITY_DN122_c0_g1_i4.p1  ORF type:complete len:205 (-),score=49.15 TRINITY_DN122_c0_g1_i4:77-691(-)
MSVLTVEKKRGWGSLLLDNEFPFLLTNRVDPDRYAQTFNAANASIQAVNRRNGHIALAFVLISAVLICALLWTIANYGLIGLTWELSVFLLTAGYITVMSRRQSQLKRELAAMFKNENSSYYHALGVNVKFVSGWGAHFTVSIEILPLDQLNNKLCGSNNSNNNNRGLEYSVPAASYMMPMYAMPQQQQQQFYMPVSTTAVEQV